MTPTMTWEAVGGDLELFLAKILRCFYGTPGGDGGGEEEERRRIERREEDKRRAEWKRRIEKTLEKEQIFVIFGGAIDNPRRARDVDIGYLRSQDRGIAEELGRKWAIENGMRDLRVDLHRLEVIDEGVVGFRAFTDQQKYQILPPYPGGVRVVPNVPHMLDTAGEIRRAAFFNEEVGPKLSGLLERARTSEALSILVALSKRSGWTRKALTGLPKEEMLKWASLLSEAYEKVRHEANPEETRELQEALASVVKREEEIKVALEKAKLLEQEAEALLERARDLRIRNK